MHVGRRRSKSIARPSSCGQQPVATSQRSCSFPLQTCQRVAVRLAFRNVSYPNPVVFTSNTHRTWRSGEMIVMALVLTTSHFFCVVEEWGVGVGWEEVRVGCNCTNCCFVLRFLGAGCFPLKIAWYPPSCHPFSQRVRVFWGDTARFLVHGNDMKINSLAFGLRKVYLHSYLQ